MKRPTTFPPESISFCQGSCDSTEVVATTTTLEGEARTRGFNLAPEKPLCVTDVHRPVFLWAPNRRRSSGSDRVGAQANDPRSSDIPKKVDGVLARSRYGHQVIERRIRYSSGKRSGMTVRTDRVQKDTTFSTGAGVSRSDVRAAAYTHGSGERPTSMELPAFLRIAPFLGDPPNTRLIDTETRSFVRPPLKRVSAWAYLDGRKRKFPRMAAIAFIIHYDRIFLLIEVERRQQKKDRRPEYFSTAIFSPPSGELYLDAHLDELLDHLIVTNGVAANDSWELTPFASWSRAGYHHVYSSDEKRIIGLRSEMNSLLH